MDGLNLLNIFTFLVGAIGLLSFAGAVVNGKRKDGYNQILEDSNKALREAAKDKDGQIIELEGKLKLAKDAAEAADKVRQTAIDIAQSRPAFEKLGTQMMKQHQELLGAIGAVTVELANVAKSISEKET